MLAGEYRVLTWRKCGIKNVDIDSDVDLRVLHTIANLIYDSLDTESVKIPCCDSCKSTSPIVFHVPFSSVQRRSDSGVDGRIAYESLFMCNM